MDLETKLKLLNANSWYGVNPRRGKMSRDVEEVIKKNFEKESTEAFIKSVNDAANEAIKNGSDINDVLHDAIEVLYGRKDINDIRVKRAMVETVVQYKSFGNLSNNDIDVLKDLENNINKKLADGKRLNPYVEHKWCSECVYFDKKPSEEPCCVCYQVAINSKIDCFKPKEEKKKEETAVPRHWCADCKYCTLGANQYPCRNCFCTDDRSYFTPKEE